MSSLEVSAGPAASRSLPALEVRIASMSSFAVESGPANNGQWRSGSLLQRSLQISFYPSGRRAAAELRQTHGNAFLRMLYSGLLCAILRN